MSNFADWRIQINENPAPIALAPTPISTGAMVIRSLKGNAEPYKITKGNSGDLFKLFGYPSATYPDVQDALDYIQDSDLWVSAPSNTVSALYGGALVTKAGTVALTEGVVDKDLFDISAVATKEEIGTGNDVDITFVFTLTGLNYVNQSISKIIVGSTEIGVTATDAEPEVLSGTGLTSGTLTRATKELTITLDVAPTLGDSIKVVYDVDYSSDAYFTIFSPSQMSNDESVLVNYNTDINQFEFDFYIKDFRGIDRKVNRYIGSNIPSTFNASNENIFIESYLEDVPYFDVKANTTLAYSTFTDDTDLVGFAGGIRNVSSFTATEFTEGWAFFQQANTYPAKIFIDVTADSAIPTIFDNLRKNHQKYSRYLCILPDNENASTSNTTKTALSIDNSGLIFYSNYIYRKENYTGTKFWSPVMGATAVKHAEIVRQIYGGLAPAGTNENGLGGQLSVVTLKVRNDYSDSDLQFLDERGINARVFDPTYGLIITSQKTGQNPAILTDFSYIGHRGTADYIIENIRKQVLVPQTVKLNDPSHRTLAKAKGDSIVAPVFGSGLLRQYLVKCDEENNSDDVLARREFVIAVIVKFTPTSERLIFQFTSVDQRVDVEEVVA